MSDSEQKQHLNTQMQILQSEMRRHFDEFPLDTVYRAEALKWVEKNPKLTFAEAILEVKNSHA